MKLGSEGTVVCYFKKLFDPVQLHGNEALLCVCVFLFVLFSLV